MALESTASSWGGEVLVTGAAAASARSPSLLAKLASVVAAIAGRRKATTEGAGRGYHHGSQGAHRRARPAAPAGRFAGVVDTVSGVIARALAQVKYGGAAAVCGLGGGPTFPGSILPFILRGVIVTASIGDAAQGAARGGGALGTDLPLDKLDSTVSEAGLSDLMTLAPKILKGEVRGRVVVDVGR